MLSTVPDSGNTAVGQTGTAFGGKETGRKYTKIQIIKGTYVWEGLRVILIFFIDTFQYFL